MIKKCLIYFILLIIPLFLYASEGNCDLFSRRLRSIMEIKRNRYIARLDYDQEKIVKVKDILDSNRDRIIEKINRKREIMHILNDLEKGPLSDKELSAIINELFDIEKEIIIIGKDQFNDLVNIISLEDALLYIRMDRRFNHELRHRSKSQNRDKTN